jgi:TonB family protein
VRRGEAPATNRKPRNFAGSTAPIYTRMAIRYSMGMLTQLQSKWEGRVIDGRFPLRQRVGGSDHSEVFLTEYQSPNISAKAALKLIPVSALDRDEEAQLLRWKQSATLSHPHLIKLFDFGGCEIDGMRFLYVVSEYAEENLGEILTLRPLSPEEATEMLRPAAEALAALHSAGSLHGDIQPSNVLAVGDQLKLSTDTLGKTGERGAPPTAYDPPEKASMGISAAGDIFSLGKTLIAVLTQKQPRVGDEKDGAEIAESLPSPLRDIAKQCLQVDPHQRCTAADILKKLQPASAPVASNVLAAATDHTQPEQARSNPWIAVAIIVAILIIGLVVGRSFWRRGDAEGSKRSEPANSQAVETPAKPPAVASSEPAAQNASSSGAVLQQVRPEVSSGALKTIHGRVRVDVRVNVDSAGSVSTATLVSAGPSKYFAERALAAARKWKFNPPHLNQQPVESEWKLRFEFRRSGVQILPSRIKP